MEEVKKVAVAMSGGVDSSVAAAMLAEKYGKENVFGVTMRLFCYGEKSLDPKNCCSMEAINDAKAVCKKIGIKHYVIDFEKEFEKEVITNFVQEYLAGHTPNPCVRCNSIIKFKYLLEKAKGLGAEYLATGHYARIDKTSEGFQLLKGLDENKDQSYFLYGMTQEQLAYTLFPLGEYKKEEVRKLAKKYDLKTAEKTESQEICFVTNNDYHGFLESQKGFEIKGGEIVDKAGNVIGKHKGLPFYTIGQRKGLGIYREEPTYVIGINIEKNQLVVGEEKDLFQKEFKVNDVNWIADEIPSEAEVMIRYNMKGAKARIEKEHKNAKVIFDEPQKSITPGQSTVFYNGDEVIGGGIIQSL